MTVELRIVAPDQRTLDAATALLVRQIGYAVAFGQAREGREGKRIAYGYMRADYAAPVSWTCPRCGRTDRLSRYCGDCGTRFPGHEQQDAAPPSFVCPRCGRVSEHPLDAETRYCGNCDLFFPEYE